MLPCNEDIECVSVNNWPRAVTLCAAVHAYCITSHKKFYLVLSISYFMLFQVLTNWSFELFNKLCYLHTFPSISNMPFCTSLSHGKSRVMAPRGLHLTSLECIIYPSPLHVNWHQHWCILMTIFTFGSFIDSQLNANLFLIFLPQEKAKKLTYPSTGLQSAE